MIKYLGSKRRLVPVLTRICQASGATTALDLFTGTTRVAQAFKAQGVHVTAVDSARYAHTFARTYIETDAAATDMARCGRPSPTSTPSPANRATSPRRSAIRPASSNRTTRARIDAVRDAIDSEYAGSPLFPLLLTSLIEAADRVDSTTGVQMAYVKQWAPRSAKPLELRVPELLDGPGRAIQGDAVELTLHRAGVDVGLGHFDLAYLDPPYNQHRYFTNYHVWETLVAWDAPEAYGVARKRLDSRDPSTRSAFNSKRTMPAALASVVQSVDCDLLVLSYNNESWLAMEELEAMCVGAAGAVATLAFDSARYVGARIGIFDPSGRKVGRVSHLSNQELVVIAGEAGLGAPGGRGRRSRAPSPATSRRRAVTGAAAAVVAAGRVDRLQQAT